MRVLLVNLKHLYQRRLLWIAYVYIGVMAFWVSRDILSREAIEGAWTLALTVGLLVGMMFHEMIAKPFTWCLPGHPFAVRNVAFLMGTLISALAIVPALGLTNAPTGHWIGVVVPAFCASMTAYLAGMAAVLFVPQRDTILVEWPVSLAWIVIAVGVTLAGFSRLHTLIFGHPLLTIGASTLVNLNLWIQLGRHEWSRRLRASGWCFSPSAQRDAYARWSRRCGAAGRAESILESFFLARMKAGMPYGCARFVWGTLYATWGHLALWRRFLVVALVFVIVLAEYAGKGAGWVFAWLSLEVVPVSCFPFRSVLLLPAGRRERLAAALSLGAVTAGVVMLFIVILALLSVPLSALVPEVEVWGLPLACQRIPLATVWVPLVIVPLIAALRIFFPQRWFPVDLLILGVAPFAFALIALALAAVAPVASMDVIFGSIEAISHMGPVIRSTVVIVFAWTLFSAACVFVCRKRSLARS